MPAYAELVAAFDQGDVLFGLTDDLAVAEGALNSAYSDGASFWNKFSRAGRKRNERAARVGDQADVKIQASLTNAVADPGVLGDRIKAAIPAIAQSRQPGGDALTQRPMISAFVPERVTQKLPHEGERGFGFAEFLEGHERYDPKLMGGKMTSEGSYAPLGSKEADRQWIAQSRKAAFEHYLTGLLDGGGPAAVIVLKNGTRVAARPKGGNLQLIHDHWSNIDWSQYDMWQFLHESHLTNVINYKIWKRTSKAGLEFQTTVRGRTVHFLLDTFLKGESMKTVVTKAGVHGTSITAGELRWLYRNWDNPRVSLNTRFWTVDGRQSPPWQMDRFKDLWKTYQPKGSRNSSNSRPLAAALEVYSEAPTGGSV